MTNVTNPSKYLASCLGQLSFRNVTNVTNPTNKYLAWDGSQFEMWQMWQIRLIFGYIWLGAHFEIYVTNVTNPTNMPGLHLAWCPFRNVTNVTNPTNIWLETAPNSKCDKLMWQIRWIFVQIRQMWQIRWRFVQIFMDQTLQIQILQIQILINPLANT
jgi:hypothetical protein